MAAVFWRYGEWRWAIRFAWVEFRSEIEAHLPWFIRRRLLVKRLQGLSQRNLDLLMGRIKPNYRRSTGK
jgi:hypothetical protein